MLINNDNTSNSIYLTPLTKQIIVERLLKENKITIAEAVVLLKEIIIERLTDVKPTTNPAIPRPPFKTSPYIAPNPLIPQNPYKDWYDLTNPTKYCSCRIENGGNGVCYCIRGINITY